MTQMRAAALPESTALAANPSPWARTRSRHTRTIALVVLVAMFATACGSTLSETARTDRPAEGGQPTRGEQFAAGDALTLESADVGNAGAGEPNSLERGANDLQPSGRPAPSSPPASTLASPRDRDRPAAAPAGGVEIGVLTRASQCGFYSMVGVEQLGCIDEWPAYEAVIDDVNSMGGLAGHRLEPNWFEAENQSDPQLQAACAHFTQDHQVVAVITGTSLARHETLRSCLAASGTPLFDADTTPIATAQTFVRQPRYFLPVAPSLDRFAKLYVDGLLSTPYLSTRWDAHRSCAVETAPKLGLVSYDLPEYRETYSRVFEPRFAARGHPIEEVAFVSYTEDAGAVARDSQAAVLRFASRCIDHVIFQDTGAAGLFFVNAASSQGYTPRYGWASPSIPAVLMGTYANPSVQMRGSIGVGWCPICDVEQAQWDAVAKRPGAARCSDLLEAAGVDKQGPAGEFYALRICDAVYFLQAAANASTGVTSAELAAGASRLGDAYEPTTTFRTILSEQQHDGAAGFRTFAFFDDCACHKYTSDVQRF